MASFESPAYLGGVPFRPTHDGIFTVNQTIVIPAGTSLALNDKLYFTKLGANVIPLSVTLKSDDLDTGTTVVLDVGYEAAVASDVLDFFIDGSTVGQAGGMIRVENGGDDPFADGVYSGIDETIDVVGLVQVAPTGDPETDRKITLVLECARANPNVPLLKTAYRTGQ